MSTFLQFAILGFTTGAIYVALALGLLTIYRATAVVNFAQGALALWGACTFVRLRSGQLVLPVGTVSLGGAVPWPIALIVGVAVAVVLAAIVHMIIFRPLRQAPVVGQVVGSIALMLALLSLAEIRFGANTLTVPRILPQTTWKVGSVGIDASSMILAGSAVLLSLLTALFFNRTSAGTAMRAAAANERAVALLGYSPNALGLIAWLLGAIISTAVVILASPASGLNETNFTLYVIPALAILLVARLRAIWAILVAGLVLGSFQSLITFYSSKSWWPAWGQVGLQDAVPFLVIVVALYLWGGRLPARGSLDASSLPRVAIPRVRPANLAVPFGVVLGLILLTSGNDRYGVITSVAVALVGLSYVVVTGYLGQISLAQIAFAGAAGFMLSKLTTSWDVPFPLTLLISALVAAALGVVVGLPALRIRGTQLAIVTIAAAVLIQEFVFSNPSFSPLSGNPVGNPSLFGFSLAIQRGHHTATLRFALMTLVVATVFFAIFIILARGSSGRAWLAIRSNERAAASAGVNVRAVKLTAFAVSAFIAGAAGALIGYSRGQLSADSFSVSTGLLMFAVTYLGGMTSPSGALVAGAIGPLGVVYVVLNAHINFGKYYALIAAIGLAVSTVLNPTGIAGRVHEVWSAWLTKRTPERPAPPPTPETTVGQPKAGHYVT